MRNLMLRWQPNFRLIACSVGIHRWTNSRYGFRRCVHCGDAYWKDKHGIK